MKFEYDYLVVGAGIFGSVFAYEAKKRGKKVLVIDKRDHIGGNMYTKNMDGIHVHYYGAHIFHTSNKEIWDYINQFAEFNNYINSPIANYKGKLYNLPFNMNTFYQLWGTKTPKEAMDKIEEDRKNHFVENPKNLEEQAINLVGLEIYEKLIKGYTAKQWGKDPKDLPAFIIKRLPLRFTYNNNYFNDRYQGIPIGGYTQIFEKMLEGIEVRLNTDFIENREKFEHIAEKILYTGAIDEFFNFEFGHLEYRSLAFDHQVLDVENFQGNAVINYTDLETPYTRIIEHKHFDDAKSKHTVITYEYPKKYEIGSEKYYPVNDDKNNEIYKRYKEKAAKESKYLFGGRLAEYKYYDMHAVIISALAMVKNEFRDKE